jgi:hypothetical protein
MEMLLLAAEVEVLMQQLLVETHKGFLEALVEATLDILQELVDLARLDKEITEVLAYQVDSELVAEAELVL